MTGTPQGLYTTSPHMLVRIRVGNEYPTLPNSSTLTSISGALSVLASYDGPFDDIFFTIDVFCGADVKAWWDETAGIGNSISPGSCEFSTKVLLGVDSIWRAATLIHRLFRRSAARSPPKMLVGIIHIRHTCLIRSGTFASMMITLGEACLFQTEEHHL